MRIALVGNFKHPWNTETHISAALQEWGEQVIEVQLTKPHVQSLPAKVRNRKVDILLWIHTSHLCPDNTLIARTLRKVKEHGVLTAAFHLDRYWDLKRESAISTEPWFQSDVVFTADGGNQDRFAAAGVNHIWMPPAVHGPDAELIGTPRDEYRAKVAFVGSWENYHPEWPWRMEMLDLLERYYGDDFRKFPVARNQPIRGQDLADLYASVDVVVGDSIFAGDKRGYGYVSDRPYLTLGHRGCLVFPHNPPLEDSFKDGVHLRYYEATNAQSMFEVIDELLADPDQREALKEQGHAEILNNHLYRHRVREMLQMMTQQRLSTLGWPGEARQGTHDATAIRETWLDDVYQVRDRFKPGDLVLDCGANVGAFTIFAALQGADVIAVEPIPDNLAQLRKNIALAGVEDRVTIIESAVGEKNGTIRLDFFDVDMSQSAYRLPEGGGRLEVPVRTIASLTDGLSNGREFVFMKMDIEGSERWALPGAPLHKFERIAIETHNTLDPGTTHERVKAWLALTHDIEFETGGHSEGYVIGVRR